METFMLRIRSFIKNHDESTWVYVLNTAYGKFRDWRAITVEEFSREMQRDRGSPYSERWVAELDGNPVGVVHVFEDKMGNENRGVIDNLAIIPKLHGSDVEKEIVRFAVNQLEKRKVKTILVPRLRWSDSAENNRIKLLEELGFNLIRKTSLMEIDLTRIPTDIEVNKRCSIRPLREHVEEDVEELNSLRNECGQGQFNFQPTTVEEIRHLLKNNPYSCFKGFFAVLDRKCVGFIIVAIDERYNSERNVKAGIILGLGVLSSYRKAGIGTALVLHGLGFLRTQQMTKAMLDVDDLNETGALRLYKKIGFKVLEKYLTYEKSFR
jgi:ribosomal protein S18 acetylase RimI-like enzyme/N-acetylglutamate synthase-like GNAT family acetyltransferase